MNTTLQEFNDLARRAFYWTSFDPEGRGARTIKDYESELSSDTETMQDEEKERYVLNYKKHFSKWLSAHSNCASSAITGGSGFNVRRAEKANNRERAAYDNFRLFRERALKAIEKRREENKPKIQKEGELAQRVLADLADSAKTIHEINKSLYPGSKSLFVANMYSRIETVAKRGGVEIVQKAINFIREFNANNSVVITERHKFFKLLEVAKNVVARIEATANAENDVKQNDSFNVVENLQEDRLQIIFNDKPNEAVRDLLKKNAFKWSPRFSAWQRQLTPNAKIAFNRIEKQLIELS